MFGGGIEPDPGFTVLTPPELVFIISVKEWVSGQHIVRLIELRLIVNLGNISIISGISDGDTLLKCISCPDPVTAGVPGLQSPSLRVPELTITILLLIPCICNHSLLRLPLGFNRGVPVDVSPESLLDCMYGDFNSEGGPLRGGPHKH